MRTSPAPRGGIALTQSWFEIRRSPIQGRGAFALRAIPKGTRLIEYTGERIGHARFAARSATEQKGRHHTFFFQATRRTVVDARLLGNEAKYINHSCHPNCRAVIENGRIYIDARRAIRKGEELAYDYSYGRDGVATAADEARYKCRCGAKRCRGSILEPVKIAIHRSVVALVLLYATAARAQPPVARAVVTVHTERPAVNRFDPRSTLGAGLDGHGTGAVDDVYTAANITAMKTAGVAMTSYRLRTELGVQAWHWNPRGRWSDPTRQQGYWTSDDSAGAPILLTHGYRLPRRGTTDENDNRGFSRLDDGDTSTYWKSNPYLDHRFTGTADSLLPQWVIVDLGRPVPVNAIRIHWGEPHATAFRVQWWRGENVHDMDESPPGRWVTFPRGDEPRGQGGVDLRRLGDTAVNARFVRLVLVANAYADRRVTAHTAAGASATNDPRDSSGYAIRELEIGTTDGPTLRDAVRHGARSSEQSTTYASSTDPWHRAEDIDLDLEQPGFDRVFRSTLTFGRPAMVPVPVLYGTPDDAAGAVRFLRRRGYAVGRIEMGEEPDGQFVTPEDYATLYAQVARAIRADWPDAPLGGPGFQGLESRAMFAWPADSALESASETWIPRFLAALRTRGRPGDFTFFSFEWYPFDDICAPAAPQLAEASARLTDRLQRVELDGLEPGIPRVIAEYGYSAFAGRAQVGLEGALLNADIVGRFLMLGGRAAYLYGWEPTSLDKSPRCESWGNNMLFLADAQRRIRARVATYHGTRMVTREWASPSGGEHTMFAAESDARDDEDNELLSAYVVRRPDSTWATLLVNKDPARSYRVTLDVGGATGGATGGRTSGPRTVVSYSGAQYEWHAAGAKGHPLRSDPPVSHSIPRGAALIVPPYSLTVIREAAARPPKHTRPTRASSAR